MKKECKVKGCERLSYAQGFCNTHYNQYRKYGKIIKAVIGPRDGAQGCIVEGCDAPHSAKGYCNAHYLQHRIHGKITSVKIVHVDPSRGCKVEGCDGKHYSKGYCLRHYAQIVKHGKIISKERLLGPRIGKMKTQGYIYLLRRDHPYAIKGGYVKRANIVWEENTGHIIKPPEEIHHINNTKTDDSFENLEWFPNSSAHMKKHHRQKNF